MANDRMDLNRDIMGTGNISSTLDSIKAINDAWQKGIAANYEAWEQFSKRHWVGEAKNIKDNLEQQLKSSAISEEQRKKIIQRLANMQEEANKKIAKQVEQVNAQLYKNASFYEKKKMAERKANAIKEQQEELDRQIAIQKVIDKGHLKESAEYQKLLKAKKKLTDEDKKQKELLEQIQKIEYKRSTIAGKASILKERAQSDVDKFKESMLNYDEAKARGASPAELSRLRGEMRSAETQALKSGWQSSLMDGLNNAINKLGESVNAALNKIDSTMSTFFQYQGKINARLQGTNITYQGMVRDVSGNIALSPYVSQKAMVENITKLVESGVAYNIEQRAFLASISDNIAHTFDVFDGNLMRLIRLQQADSTAARLGMEAMITEVLNSRFSDTSYLNSTYDAVSQALIDTNSTLTRDQSLALEYTVQKWLGSLGALGFSESATSQIATGLNLLGTGNVSALSSNSQLQTLLAMSASRAGIPYADILTGGLTAETTNSLLLSMIQYLREIADTNNMVVKAQYGQLFGLSMSDFRALQNLRESDITSLYASSMSYGGAIENLNQQMRNMSTRMSIAQMMDNIVENAISGVAGSIGSNVASYAMWKVTDLIEKATGGINIPAVFAVGTGVDLNATVTQLMKLGIAGANVLSLIGPIVNSFSNGFGLNLDTWGGTPYTRRGEGFVGVRNGVVMTTSQTAYVASGSSRDMYQDTLLEQKARAEETQQILGTEGENTKDIFALLESVIEKETELSSIRVKVVNDMPILVKIDQPGYLDDGRGATDFT